MQVLLSVYVYRKTTVSEQTRSLEMKSLIVLLNVACICHIVSSQSDVRIPPTIRKGPEKSIIYRIYENVTLECRAEGTPAVRYEWKKNGVELNTNLSNIRKGSDGTITIERATEQDVGYYQCFAKNLHGTSVSNMIDVRMAFIDFTVKPSTVHQKTVVEGTPFHIPAFKHNCYPDLIYLWVISSKLNADYTLLVFSNRKQWTENGDLHFAYALPEDADGGRFYTSVGVSDFLRQEIFGSTTQLTVTRNPVGTISQFAPTLAFSSEAQTVAIVGHTVYFRCFFYGNPEPKISWAGMKVARRYAQRYKKEINDTTLILDRIAVSDEGTYACLGTNTQGNSTYSFQLRVEDVPKFKNTKDAPYDVNVTEGESVTFNCNAIAIPEANITWFQNGQPIDTDNPPERFVFSIDNKSLTIRDVCRDCFNQESKTDLMVIQCNASNAHGYAFASGYLNVLSKTKVTIRGLKNVSVDFLEEKQFVFQCYATSDPSTPTAVRWYKTEPFDELVRDEPPYIDVKTQTLVIRIDGNCSANCVNYLGEYRCVGDNGYSRENSTITISYQYRPLTGAVIQEEETWASWKIFLGAGAIGLVLFLIGIFIGFRSNRSVVEVNRRTIPSIYEDGGYDPIGFPLEELTEDMEGPVTKQLNVYEHIGYDSVDQTQEEIALREEAMPHLPDAHEYDNFESTDAPQKEAISKDRPMLDKGITCDDVGYLMPLEKVTNDREIDQQRVLGYESVQSDSGNVTKSTEQSEALNANSALNREEVTDDFYPGNSNLNPKEVNSYLDLVSTEENPYLAPVSTEVDP